MNTFFLGLLRYIKGTAAVPHSSDNRMILNLLDMDGEWSDPFSTDLAKRWPKAKEQFRAWFRSKNKFALGEYQIVQVQSDTSIVNLLVKSNNTLDLVALDNALVKLGKELSLSKSNVHISKIAGDNWPQIESLLKTALLKKAVNVTVYE
jgi:hypothetical protein